uniref:Uncharacterized protein n=1 Tax=Anguilla anguilla TaxID=7936 RepID=A0A0E9SWT5_ANGAN
MARGQKNSHKRQHVRETPHCVLSVYEYGSHGSKPAASRSLSNAVLLTYSVL